MRIRAWAFWRRAGLPRGARYGRRAADVSACHGLRLHQPGQPGQSLQRVHDIHVRRQLTQSGAHTLKAGFDGRLIRVNNRESRATSGDFSFTAGFTQGPNPNTATQPIAATRSPACCWARISGSLIQSFKDVAATELLYGPLFPGRLARQQETDPQPGLATTSTRRAPNATTG